MKTKLPAIFLVLFAIIWLNCQSTRETSPIIKHIKVYASHDEYCAWPDILRAANGDLLVSFCINEEHLGPDGKIVTCRSTDNGETWQMPAIVLDTPIDDREPGFSVLNDGRIITHNWTSFWTSEKYKNLGPNSYEQDMIDRWVEHVEKPAYKNAHIYEGESSRISEDNGHSWTDLKYGKDSCHGGIQLPDGTLLIAAYRLDSPQIGVYSTASPEEDWQRIALISSPQPDSLNIAEPHLLQLPSGRIVMMIRVTSKPYNDGDPRCLLHCTYSDDNGKTWVEPYATPLWGYPPHLLLLSDGRVVCSYGYRKPPFGERACVSDDGITWKKENEIILRDDAFNKDLGYPASVELEPGKVLTVYYQPDPEDGDQRMTPPDPNRSRPDILGTIWKVPSK